MDLQTFLRTDPNAIKTLKEDWGINVKPHPKWPNLLLFKYNQIFSYRHFDRQEVRDSRGCILDSADNWKYVSRPFSKFFNEGEQFASKIDWKTCSVQEKLDGSMMPIYWYDGNWQIQSSGTPDAGGKVGQNGMTFAELFMDIWHKTNMGSFPSPRWKEFTFIYEMMAKENRVVVQHKEPRLVLIGIRNNVTGQELALDNEMMHLDYPKVRAFPLQTLDQINETLKVMSPFGDSGQEGYVVVDSQFNRIKCKSPAYVAVHHAIDHFGPKKCIEIIQLGESTEVLQHFPEWKDEFTKILNKFNSLIEDAARAWSDYVKPEPLPFVDPKSKANIAHMRARFAEYATKTPHAPALFYQYSEKGSVKDFYFSRPPNYILDAIGMKDKTDETE